MRAVAIVGVGQTKFQHHYADLTYPELLFLAVNRALADAGTTIAEVDGVVLAAAPDALIGVAHAERWAADAVGAVGKPLVRVNTGGVTGLTAVQVAHDLVASRQYDVILVAGADRVGESGEAQTILNRIWDPIYERSLPLNTITMLAMQAVRFMHRYGATEEDMARISVKNHANGIKNAYAHIQQAVTVEEVLSSRMIAYPLKLLDTCPQSSGGAAVLLCAEGLVDRFLPQPAWIRGLGHSSETYWIGDRMGPVAEADHGEAPALEAAARQAYRMAGIKPTDVDVAELYAPFSSVELHAIQDVGLCPRGEVIPRLWAGEFDLASSMPVNPSGGVMCANAISATAMVRVIEAALQVQGRAGDHQVANADDALATGIGGDHQFFGVILVSNQRGGSL